MCCWSSLMKIRSSLVQFPSTPLLVNWKDVYMKWKGDTLCICYVWEKGSFQFGRINVNSLKLMKQKWEFGSLYGGWMSCKLNGESYRTTVRLGCLMWQNFGGLNTNICMNRGWGWWECFIGCVHTWEKTIWRLGKVRVVPVEDRWEACWRCLCHVGYMSLDAPLMRCD